MTRSFLTGAVAPEALRRMLEAGRQAPSAGFTQAVDWVVLTSRPEMERFFEAVSEEAFRTEPGSMAGLLRAGAALVPVVDPEAYVRRYSDKDKETTPLAGRPAEAWDVAYWTVDAAFAVMSVLLAAEDEGLGALFFRPYRGAGPLSDAFGIPPGREIIGAVVIGHLPDGQRPATGSAAGRPRRPFDDQVHFGRW
jgi:nitroreductase